MKRIILLTLFVSVCNIDAQAAMDHSRHRGMGGRTEKGGAACVRPRLSKIQPAHLAEISPGGEFSFVLSNIDDPEQISVEVKRMPVEIKTTFVNPYYVVKGKIPESLQNTVARVDVKVDSKVSSCRAEDGWLLKISGN